MNRKQYKYKFNKIAENSIYNTMFGSSNTKFFPLPFSKTIKKRLETEYFFTNRKEVSYENENGNLIIQVEKHRHNQVYLSYLTLDNNFNEVPENPLINKDYREYYIQINYIEKELIIRPFLIFYNRSSKTRLYELTENIEKIIFKEDEEFCRLTFKLEGFGAVNLKNIELNFLEIGDPAD